MGQNTSKGEGSNYNSEQFFRQQLEFYQWRADPKLNTHISRVSFQPTAFLRDRVRLANFLEGNCNSQHLNLTELRSLGQGRQGEREEAMIFEDYVCRLAELRQRLSLGETLYAVQTMLSGYEMLLAKAGRIRADLDCCFVTRQGELRVWLNPDYKSNEIPEKDNAISSEMTVIKRAMELGQQLACNHTEFLHFSRQFRALMERDILQNWNFIHSRKLINSYTYAYKLQLATSLKEAISRYPPTYTPAPTETSLQFSSATLKEQMLSTSSGAFKREGKRQDQWIRGQVLTQGRKEEAEWAREYVLTEGSKNNQAGRKQVHRPLSHSDLNSKSASDLPSQATIKSHSKKPSSIDLRHPSDRNKGCQSPKAQYYLKPTKEESSPMPTQRIRRDSGADVKTGNSVRFSPMPSILYQSPALGSFQSDKPLQKQKEGQRKKLQKKTATAFRYINFIQNQERILQSNEETSRLDKCTISNIVHCTTPSSDQVDQHVSAASSVLTHLRNKLSQPNLNQKLTPPKELLTHRGHTQMGVSQCPSMEGTRSPYCHTIKTVNNLLDDEVSLHESQGSFMSLPNSQTSQYHGMLCQMGRSVNVMNLPSNKHLLARKNSSNAHLNRSNQ